MNKPADSAPTANPLAQRAHARRRYSTNAGHAGDHRRDQDDEPDNYDHDALRKSEL